MRLGIAICTGLPGTWRSGWLPLLCAAGLLAGCQATGPRHEIAGRAPYTDPSEPPQPAHLGPETPIFEPESLIGLEQRGLRRVLGEPHRIRNESGIEIWQYRGGACVLDLFLYDDSAGIARVAYVEARSVRAEPMPVESCIRSLARPENASAEP